MKLPFLPAPGDTGFSPVYHAQRRPYNERYGVYKQSATRATWLAAGSIAVSLFSVAYLGYDGSLSKYVPYIVAVDRFGDGAALSAAEKTAPTDPRVVQAEVKRWVRDVRRVSSDMQDEHQNIFEAYDHTNSKSACEGQLNDWFRNNTPWERAKTELVTATIISALPRNPPDWKNWEIKWWEETRTRAGDLQSKQAKEMSMTVVYRQPKTQDDYDKNHSGVFCDSFNWDDK